MKVPTHTGGDSELASFLGYLANILELIELQISSLDAPNRTPRALSGAKLAEFEMGIHDVTPTKLEVKEINGVQFPLKTLL
jgi:hypothetical protein